MPQCTATRRARTIVTTLAIYAALGFATSWAVAWGFAALVHFKQNHLEVGGAQTNAALFEARGMPWVETASTWASVRRLWWFDDMLGSQSPLLRSPDQELRSFICWSVLGVDSWGDIPIPDTAAEWKLWGGLEEARGFPALCLWCSYEPIRAPGSSHSTGFKVQGGFELPPFEQPGSSLTLRALPYRPIWSGLAFNTAFYGLIWFGVIRIPRGVRRARRVNHGRCPKCAYDRRGDYSTPCPECGWTPRIARISPEQKA